MFVKAFVENENCGMLLLRDSALEIGVGMKQELPWWDNICLVSLLKGFMDYNIKVEGGSGLNWEFTKFFISKKKNLFSLDIFWKIRGEKEYVFNI